MLEAQYLSATIHMADPWVNVHLCVRMDEDRSRQLPPHLLIAEARCCIHERSRVTLWECDLLHAYTQGKLGWQLQPAGACRGISSVAGVSHGTLRKLVRLNTAPARDTT